MTSPLVARRLAVAGLFGCCALAALGSMRPHAKTTAPATRSSAQPMTASRFAVPSTRPSNPPTDASTVTPTSPALSTVAPTTTLPAGDDSGRLPQTDERPRSDTTRFRRVSAELWSAIVDDNPAKAAPFFFPKSAYRQVKDLSDPDVDWTSRLWSEFSADVTTYHDRLGAGARATTFVGLEVPSAQMQWITPGVEYNRGSYWRVLNSELRYRTRDGSLQTLAVASLISWRGEWYVVHLASIR